VESQPTRVVYCADTSSLVNVQRKYPLAVFPGVWDRLSELASEGRLVAAREVLNELARGGDDEIYQWAREHKFMFEDPDGDQIEAAREIVNDQKFQGLFDIDSESPHADPYVIALAATHQRRGSLFPSQYIVVAEEVRAQPGRKPRIPDVCSDPRYQLECINMLEMFKREGWEFVKKVPGGTT